MMLPQQLEGALLGDEGGEEAAQLVSDWIDKASLPGGLRSSAAVEARVCCNASARTGHLHCTCADSPSSPAVGRRWPWRPLLTTNASWAPCLR